MEELYKFLSNQMDRDRFMVQSYIEALITMMLPKDKHDEFYKTALEKYGVFTKVDFLTNICIGTPVLTKYSQGDDKKSWKVGLNEKDNSK